MKSLKYLCILLAISFITSGPAHADGKSAYVFSVDGDVKVVPYNSSIGIVAEEGMVLQEGDWVKTGNGAKATIAFDKQGSNVIEVKENSIVIIKLDGYLKIQLLAGEIYAILENVEKGDTFRVLTPSVVTESASSGWGATSDGAYTNVVVFNDRVFVCGINEDGTVKDKKYWIQEGYQRKTVTYEDPGSLEPVPENVMSWFEGLVVEHHLDKVVAREFHDKGLDKIAEKARESGETKKTSEEVQRQPRPGTGNTNTIIADGEEVNLVEYLYKKRLRQSPQKNIK